MHFRKDFDLFIGGKSGVFKGVKVGKKACITKNIKNLISLTRDDEVTALSWADENEKDVLIGCGGDETRSVKIYDTEHMNFSNSFVCDIGKGKITGISRYDNAVITAMESGHVKLWRDKEKEQLLIEAGENLHKMRHSIENKNIIATGGKENKLKLFDLEKNVKVFEEKNIRHDWLEMKVPLWISDIGFIPNSSQIATCSRYGNIRLYDPNAQRRPVVDMVLKDEALVTLAVSCRQKHVVVGSGKGVMKLVDLRKPGRILNTYKDFAGGITSIACTKYDPYIASVGLDRFLRIHDLNTKKLLLKHYMTSRLTCMVLRSDFKIPDSEYEENEENEVMITDEV